MLDCEIKFRTEETFLERDNGDIIPVSEWRTAFAEKKSIKQTEFYQAAANGLKPELVFKIWQIDYQDEDELMYEDKLYRIIRTFESDIDMLELVCERDVNQDANA